MVYNRLPLYAGFFVAPEARGAKVVAALLANLDTWKIRADLSATNTKMAGAVQSLQWMWLFGQRLTSLSIFWDCPLLGASPSCAPSATG